MADDEHPAAPPEGESTGEQTPETEAAAQGPTEAAQEAEAPTAEQPDAQTETPEPLAAEEPVPAEETPAVDEPAPAVAEATAEEDDEDEEEPAPREKPAVPGAHLEVDIVPEGVDPLGRSEGYEDAYAVDPYAVDEVSEQSQDAEEEQELTEPISTAAIDLASGARYRATGKRKSAIARVTLRPGTGSYLVNGRTLEEHFPRLTLQRNIRQPLETVGYQDRMDVVARLHGGGISAQAGALRHGVSRALLEADPNLRGELKRRGFLTRDSRAKERKKAGLKKARKRPQFSKR
jgi:small subunit ribosomal protein S9